jgi:hypothetical protein
VFLSLLLATNEKTSLDAASDQTPAEDDQQETAQGPGRVAEPGAGQESLRP